MKDYGLFLGCLAPNRYPGIEVSTRVVLDTLGIKYADMNGASCCPAPGVTRSFDQTSWLAVGARNLVIAEKMNTDIMTICNGCHGSLFEVSHELRDEEKKKKVNKILDKAGLSYEGDVDVWHFADILYREVGLEKIKSMVKRPLGLKVAVHYGCHFLKPSTLKRIDDPERPKIIDEIVEALGCESVDYKDKLMCCGAGGGVRARNKDIALKMTSAKIKNVKKVGADVIVNPCPFCHLQFDRGQVEATEKGFLEDDGHPVPVLHLAQIMAMAFGLEEEKLGLDLHQVPVKLSINT